MRLSGPVALGCDPGLRGALVWVDPRARVILHHRETPLTAAGELDHAAILEDLQLGPRPDACALERPSAMPARKPGASPGGGQGVASAFNFGETCGFMHGALLSLFGKVYRPRPNVWKAQMGVTHDKKQCCEVATRLFPESAGIFYGPRGGLRDGIAEAALLALWAGRFSKWA